MFQQKLKEFVERNLNRPGKVIPNKILMQMGRSYQYPTKDEGFTRIYY